MKTASYAPPTIKVIEMEPQNMICASTNNETWVTGPEGQETVDFSHGGGWPWYSGPWPASKQGEKENENDENW